MKTFKTPKGTELPLMDIRGKDYLQVAHRLVWFREEKPDWTIETAYLVLEKDRSVAKATIKAPSGVVMATAHKSEDSKGFADHMEKAETGAIGRALAMCGYGTQFAPELEEGERLADSPIDRSVGSRQDSIKRELASKSNKEAPNQTKPPINETGPNSREAAGMYKVKIGKFREKLIKDIEVAALTNWVEHFMTQDDLSYDMKMAIKAGKTYLGI